MVFVVSYDITDDRRRTRVARALEDFGSRVQYSVFELDVSAERFAVALGRVEKVIDTAEDSVRVYTLCERCVGAARTIGKSRDTATPAAIVL